MEQYNHADPYTFDRGQLLKRINLTIIFIIAKLECLSLPSLQIL